MGKTTYLGYVYGGVCRDTHAPMRDDEGNAIKPPMIRKQLWVQEALRRQGIEAWCGTRVEFKRRGKRREWTRYDVPALPNYLVIEMDPEQMFIATQIEHLAPTFAAVGRDALHGVPASKDGRRPARIGLLQFKAAVEADFEAAQRVDANSRASVTEYKRGQSLRVVRGPFADMLVTFDKMVKAPGSQWQTLSVELESGIKAQFDPLDLRSA